MNLTSFVNAPWAITQEAFNEVQAVYARHTRGEQADLKAIEARIGKPLDNSRSPMQLQDGVAIISLEGVLAKRANLFMQISGGTSYQIAGQQLADALADPQVKAIVLAVDSPGGTVDGAQALADQVYAARGKKPITAIADGMACSAAYWIASAADKVYITDDTTVTGSIGVITTHVDSSAADMANGVRKTEIKAGRYKQMGSSNAPLGVAERDALQGQVDAVYQVFLNAVARNRGVSIDQAAAMGDGKIYLGSSAIEAGLVDGVSSLGQLIASPASGLQSSRTPLRVTASSQPDSNGAQPMTSNTSIAAAAANTAATGKPRVEDSHKIVALARRYIDEQYATSGIEIGAAEALDHIRATVDPALYTSEPAPEAEEDENAAALRQVDHAGVRRAQRYVDEMHAKGINVSAIEALEHVGVTGG